MKEIIRFIKTKKSETERKLQGLTMSEELEFSDILNAKIEAYDEILECIDSFDSVPKELVFKLIEKIEKVEKYTLLAAKNVLNFEDVALLTGLSKSHLYRLTCTHQIPHYKPNGKQLYFDRAEVEAWMKQGKIATDEEVEQRAATYIVTGKQKGGKK